MARPAGAVTLAGSWYGGARRDRLYPADRRGGTDRAQLRWRSAGIARARPRARAAVAPNACDCCGHRSFPVAGIACGTELPDELRRCHRDHRLAQYCGDTRVSGAAIRKRSPAVRSPPGSAVPDRSGDRICTDADCAFSLPPRRGLRRGRQSAGDPAGYLRRHAARRTGAGTGPLRGGGTRLVVGWPGTRLSLGNCPHRRGPTGRGRPCAAHTGLGSGALRRGGLVAGILEWAHQALGNGADRGCGAAHGNGAGPGYPHHPRWARHRHCQRRSAAPGASQWR